MDFEVDQSCDAVLEQAATRYAHQGDLLVIYDLANGGTNPILSIRTWTGSASGEPRPT